MKKPIALLLFAFLVLALPASPQEKSDKFPIFVTGLDDAAPVAQSLIKKLNASKPFEVVGKNDIAEVVVLVTCYSRKQTDPFLCMCVTHFNGPAFKTFMGGGMFAA